MQKELDSEKPEGEQALNDLFKSIYGKVSVWWKLRITVCIYNRFVIVCLLLLLLPVLEVPWFVGRQLILILRSIALVRRCVVSGVERRRGG